jgi:hypothetical protein
MTNFSRTHRCFYIAPNIESESMRPSKQIMQRCYIEKHDQKQKYPRLHTKPFITTSIPPRYPQFPLLSTAPSPFSHPLFFPTRQSSINTNTYYPTPPSVHLHNLGIHRIHLRTSINMHILFLTACFSSLASIRRPGARHLSTIVSVRHYREWISNTISNVVIGESVALTDAVIKLNRFVEGLFCGGEFEGVALTFEVCYPGGFSGDRDGLENVS